MNERIKELADKAIEDMPGAWNIPDEFCKKFAELIVRECAGVCDDERDSNDSEFGKLVAECCAIKIMQRFGVEE